MLKEPVIRKNIGKIGTNPDIIVKDGEIFLKQRNGIKVRFFKIIIMKYQYELRIYLVHLDSWQRLEEILGVSSPEEESIRWGYIIESEAPVDFISYFISILDGKYEQLSEIGVSVESISFWLIYEYEDACEIFFTPSQLELVGKSGITLCISCY